MNTPIIPLGGNGSDQASVSLNLNSPQQMGTYQDLTKKPKSILKGMSIPLAIILINIFILVGGFFFAWTKLTTMTIDRNPDNKTTIDSYKSKILGFDVISGYPGITHLTIGLGAKVDQITFDTILSSTIPFIFKRDLMEEKVDVFGKQLLIDSEILNRVQEDIAKYGFLHQDVMNLLQPDEDTIPITTLLHTIETVKFGTALKIFSLLDTFLIQTSRILNLDKGDLADSIVGYTKRGEKDIDHFLSTCYLNPYETLPDCDQIGDFANYFRYDQKDTTIDVGILAKVLVIISNKLEQTDLPSLQIAFDNFSPKAKELGFNVTINTLPEDEVAFLAKGIINPHIFIISTLVNLLKQSIFVIGNTINVNKLNIQKKMFTVGDIQIPVSTSSMKFNLPLQGSSEREIYDYYNFANDTGFENIIIESPLGIISSGNNVISNIETGDITSIQDISIFTGEIIPITGAQSGLSGAL